MSSRIDYELGCVVITAPGGDPGYEVGRRFWPVGAVPVFADASELQRARELGLLPVVKPDQRHLASVSPTPVAGVCPPSEADEDQSD